MPTKIFQLTTEMLPKGDQPKAIQSICHALREGDKHHVLVGVTGSGKTFTMANVIAELEKPTLIIAPNKTLAAQLFTEFKTLFPHDSVGFFISYYDYYQPEAYVPSTDTYIAKDSSINEDIDKMRHEATQNLFEKRNVIIIASVSCIYGLGSPETYANLVVKISKGQELDRNQFLRSLIDIQYSRNDHSLVRGHFRVRGDVVDILPSHQMDEAIRVEFWGDEIEDLSIIDSLTGKKIKTVDAISIYPNSHYVADKTDMKHIVKDILTDLGIQLRNFNQQNKLVEYQRLEQRTLQDVETLEHLGFCPGIENYSRYLTGKKAGEPPPTLLDYFPKDFLTIIDESHITTPQIGGMYKGDRSRKETLVNHGFRLPSALDNRPLNFNEFLERNNQILYVSATPRPFEVEAAKGKITEQIIRPTGLIDPEIIIKPAKNQVDDLLVQLRKTIEHGARALVTTLTKKMAEDLTDYYRKLGIRIRYLHADIESLERVDLIRDLRKGEFDVLVGINLLREGLDIPEVELVAVMDADKEGFLRSRSSLIQIVGRAARNANAKVYFYADRTTDSMQEAINETSRRRQIQMEYNKIHNITPKTIIKDLQEDIRVIYGIKDKDTKTSKNLAEKLQQFGAKELKNLHNLVKIKTKEMQKLAGNLEFEKAAAIRDEIKEIKEMILQYDGNLELGN